MTKQEFNRLTLMALQAEKAGILTPAQIEEIKLTLSKIIPESSKIDKFRSYYTRKG